MANLKNITDLPVVESAEGLNLIVNDNGSAKQIAASAIGSKAIYSWSDLIDKPTESIDGAEKLKEDVIPDTIARVSDVQAIAADTQTTINTIKDTADEANMTANTNSTYIGTIPDSSSAENVVDYVTSLYDPITAKLSELEANEVTWDDIVDRPFGEILTKGKTIIDTMTVPVFTGTHHSISNSILSYSEGNLFAIEFDGKLYGCTLILIGGSSPMRYQFAAGNLSMANSSLEDNGLPFCLYGARGETGSKIFVKDNTVSHVFGAYEGAVGTNTIDEKFIPDTIARTENLPKITAEDWIFTLEDGSTVTKKVAVMS